MGRRMPGSGPLAHRLASTYLWAAVQRALAIVPWRRVSRPKLLFLGRIAGANTGRCGHHRFLSGPFAASAAGGPANSAPLEPNTHFFLWWAIAVGNRA